MSTSAKTKSGDDDDDAILSTGESPRMSNGECSYDSIDEMLESWQERFSALASEVKQFGGHCVYAFGLYDEMATDSRTGTTHTLFDYRGNYHTCIGLCSDLQDLIKRG